MKLFNITVVLYLIVMHIITYFYCLNYIGIGFYLTYTIVSISSLVIILASFVVFISNFQTNKNYKGYLFILFSVILPISISYYLPFIFYSQTVKYLYKIFPNITTALIYISYNPTFYLATIPQLVSSIITALIAYFYFHFKKFSIRK